MKRFRAIFLVLLFLASAHAWASGSTSKYQIDSIAASSGGDLQVPPLTSPSATDLKLFSNSGADLGIVIQSGSGNVGIGTSSPSYPLQVGSAPNFSVDSSGNTITARHMAVGPGATIDNNSFFNPTPGSYLESLYQSVTSMPAGESPVAIVAQTDVDTSSNQSAQGIFGGCTNNASSTATGNSCIAMRGNATSFAAVNTASMAGFNASAINQGTGTVGTLTGGTGTAQNVSGGGPATTAVGLKGQVTNQVSGATFTTASAFSALITSSTSSTMTTANGLLLNITNNATVGTYNGVNIATPAGVSTITAANGINLSDMGSSHITTGINLLTNASNAAFNLKATGTSPNYFQGNVGIGTTAPGALLSVGSSQGFNVDGSGDATLTGILQLPVQASGTTPTCAGTSDDGKLALTNAHVLCVCNGTTPAWVDASNGLTACTF